MLQALAGLQLGQELDQVVAGELPVERPRHLFVVRLKPKQAILELDQAGEAPARQREVVLVG